MNQLAERLAQTVRCLVAQELWQLGAISVNLEKPFRLVSGNYSPIYIDCRRLMSSVSFADVFAAATRLATEHNHIEFDVVAGGESAGIPFAAFVARAFNKPMIYVRKSAKGHGLGTRIEGLLPPSATVLLVEDLITDAGSKLSFIEAITEASGTVSDVLVVFDRLQGGGDALAARGVRLCALTDLNTALAEGASSNLLSLEDIHAVKQYLSSPAEWHRIRGLPFQG